MPADASPPIPPALDQLSDCPEPAPEEIPGLLERFAGFRTPVTHGGIMVLERQLGQEKVRVLVLRDDALRIADHHAAGGNTTDTRRALGREFATAPAQFVTFATVGGQLTAPPRAGR